MKYVPLIAPLCPFYLSSALNNPLLQALMDIAKTIWKSWLNTLKILSSILWVLKEYQALTWTDYYFHEVKKSKLIFILM